jgi:hypothetical protein
VQAASYYSTHFSLQADTYNHLIRAIEVSSGLVTTLAGQTLSDPFSDGFGTVATFNKPWGIAINPAGTFALVVSILLS